MLSNQPLPAGWGAHSHHDGADEYVYQLRTQSLAKQLPPSIDAADPDIFSDRASSSGKRKTYDTFPGIYARAPKQNESSSLFGGKHGFHVNVGASANGISLD